MNEALRDQAIYCQYEDHQHRHAVEEFQICPTCLKKYVFCEMQSVTINKNDIRMEDE